MIKTKTTTREVKDSEKVAFCDLCGEEGPITRSDDCIMGWVHLTENITAGDTWCREYIKKHLCPTCGKKVADAIKNKTV